MPAPTKAAKKVVRKPKPAAAPVSQARVRAAAMPPIDPDGTSDLALAMREMLKGGETRAEVMHRVKAELDGKPTRTGRPKPTSTIMNHAVNRAVAHGYKVVQSWRLERDPDYIEPEKPAKRVVAPRAPKKAVKAVKATKKPAAVKATAEPAPTKRVRKPAPAAPTVAAPPAKKLAIRKPGPVKRLAPKAAA